MLDKKLEQLLFLSWAISLVATAGSLFLSTILKYPPCDLCWYQRIFIYPLVIIIAIAIVKKDYSIYRYVLPLSILGGGIALYHYMIQKISFFANQAKICGMIPCTGEYINYFGFITIPFLSFIAFFLIFISNIIIRRLLRKVEQH